MPATFAAISTALGHALPRCTADIVTAADIGAGTGAAGWAATELIDSLEELHCFERVPAMRTLGMKLMEEAEIPVRTVWHDADITAVELPQSYDLITAGYMLGELAAPDRERVIRKLWEKTGAMLLIAEPGTKKGYSVILQARELLMSLGAGIAYPCPAVKQCPLSEGDWCHFTARAARSKLHKQLKGGDVPYEDEKFSAIAAVRGSVTPCTNRILRHPQVASGVITLRMCSADGVSDVKITKSSKLFKAARKADCGDEIF